MTQAKNFIWRLLLLAIVIRLAAVAYQWQVQPHYTIQQDNYASYAQAWKNGQLQSPSFVHAETRLFPGYPWLIMVVMTATTLGAVPAGMIISLVSGVGAIYVLWRLTGNRWVTGALAFFPPVWITIGAKVATEPLTMAGSLLSIWLWQRQHWWLVGLILGFLFTVRNISFFLLLAMVGIMISKKQYRQTLILLSWSAVPVAVFLLNNLITWQDPLYQFRVYGGEYQKWVGIVAFVDSLDRTWRTSQYRVLVSGVAYVLWTMGGFVGLTWKRHTNELYRLVWLWALGSLVFVWALSHETFLEDFSRYVLAFLPATILGWFSVEKTQLKR